jgi:hypothetical protein
MSEKKYINIPSLEAELEKRGYILTYTENTSLTAEQDKTKNDRKKKKRQPRLENEETENAIEKLVRKFPQIEKIWSDPPLFNQLYCSVSFVPAKGAKPDSEGLYGILKVRGTFPNEQDRDAYADKLINEFDSYHEIYHGFTGQPLPLVHGDDDRYVLETDYVALKKRVQQEISDEVLERRKLETKRLEEAKERAKNLQEKEKRAIENNEVDHEEKYTRLRVKRANLIFSLYEMLKQSKKYKDTLLQTIEMINKMDLEFPQFQTTFYDNYKRAAEEVGIPDEKNYIIRYLVGPVPFDLSMIPDQLPVVKLADGSTPPEPNITPFDPDAISPHTTAQEIYERTKALKSGTHLDLTVPSGATPLPAITEVSAEEEKKMD